VPYESLCRLTNVYNTSSAANIWFLLTYALTLLTLYIPIFTASFALQRRRMRRWGVIVL